MGYNAVPTLALLLIAGAHLGSAMDISKGIFKTQYVKTQMDDAGMEWTVDIKVSNFNTVLGFSIFFYIDEFGFGDNVTVTGYTGDFFEIDIFPISTMTSENSVQSGTLQEIHPSGQTGPVWITPICNYTAPSSDPESCQTVSPESIIVVSLTTDMPITSSQLLVGGPRITSPNNAVFAFDQTIQVEDDTPSPSPPPFSPPPSPPAAPPLPGRSFSVPPPPQGIVKSDPHITGFNGAKFNFVGKPGKVYNLVTDYADGEVDIVINVELAQAYTTGLSNDDTTLGLLPYTAEGTWVKAVGIAVNDIDLTTSVDTDFRIEQCILGDDTCLRYGSLTIMSRPVNKVGIYEFGDNVEVEVKNSKTYSRVVLRSDILEMTMDMVRPPLFWDIEGAHIEEYSHINLSIDRIDIHNAKGILGETANAPPEDPDSESGSYAEKIIEESYEVKDLSSPLPEH